MPRPRHLLRRPDRAALLLLLPLGALAACQGAPAPAPPITERFTDDFERDELGALYTSKAEGDAYRISGGVLGARGAYNRPLWLRRPIPRDAVVELDAWSNSPDGDIKLELWGDGRSYDPDKGAYVATSYVFVMGGWKNSKSIVARRDEHAPGLPSRTEPKVERGRKYHWKIVRRGGRIDWYVDDPTTPFLTYDDPEPLEGPAHQHLGFNNWESDAWFDNLVIEPAR